MLETLDAAAVRRWCGGGLEALRAHQHEIDELNVYPVPDGDTGTNLVLTLTAAQQALDEAFDDPAGDPAPSGSALPGSTSLGSTPLGSTPLGSTPLGSTPLGSTLRRMARGALLGARGNSGVIVSQILRGMADSLATSAAARGADLARALRSASEAAYAAVARPVEGTVLSVVAAAAEAAGTLKSDDLVAVARAAARAAAEALARTPQQLPVLARAGVVDAGGRGLVLLLDALVDALTTPGSAVPPVPTTPTLARSASVAPPPSSSPEAGPTEGVIGYEVQYLLEADEPAVATLRTALDGMGDSLVVVGSGDGTWNVHIHVSADRIGPALEAGVVAGRPHRINVTPLEDGRPHTGEPRPPAQSHAGTADSRAPQPWGAGSRAAQPWGADPGAAQPGGGRSPDFDLRAAVVVAAGDGLTALFEAEGATVVGRNPSVREMAEAITASGAGSVVLLPNDANTQAVAAGAAREAEAAGVRVSVVPTRSPVQALAALAVRDPARPFADDVIAMAEAAGACRYGEVCTAQRDSLTVAGPCRAGDLLGLVDGEVHVIGEDLGDVSRRLLDRMLGGGGELATLVLGADVPAALEATLRGHVTQAWPFVELACYAGGQPRYHLLVGVE